MGKNIYGDSKLGLREIIQNSIDVCKLMREVSKKNRDILVDPQIYITYSKKNNYVRIKDTGIGMTLDVVKKHFLNIGKSYYKSNEYIYENYEYKPIGQYGIGFLACFLLSDNVTVKTKYYKTNEINHIELEKNSEYVVTNTEETGSFTGTEISLDYDGFFKIFKNKPELISFIEKYFYTSIPINVRDDDSDEQFVRLSNCCNKYIENKLSKEFSNKYETINCGEYSENVKGNFYICETKQKKYFQIARLDEANTKFYYFDKKDNLFKELIDINKLESGYYHMLQYANISSEEYDTIHKTRKNDKNKRNDIISISDKVYLLIDKYNEIGYIEISDSNFHKSINNITFCSILENSGLLYYDEMLEDFDYFEPIFIYGHKYINLQHCGFDSSYYYRKSDADNIDFYFYNKGVWIKYFRYLSCALPHALRLMGIVNYYGDNIKLDVSRNSIINGHDYLKYEFANIILKYMKTKTDNVEWLEMLERL